MTDPGRPMGLCTKGDLSVLDTITKGKGVIESVIPQIIGEVHHCAPKKDRKIVICKYLKITRPHKISNEKTMLKIRHSGEVDPGHWKTVLKILELLDTSKYRVYGVRVEHEKSPYPVTIISHVSPITPTNNHVSTEQRSLEVTCFDLLYMTILNSQVHLYRSNQNFRNTKVKGIINKIEGKRPYLFRNKKEIGYLHFLHQSFMVINIIMVIP